MTDRRVTAANMATFCCKKFKLPDIPLLTQVTQPAESVVKELAASPISPEPHSSSAGAQHEPHPACQCPNPDHKPPVGDRRFQNKHEDDDPSCSDLYQPTTGRPSDDQLVANDVDDDVMSNEYRCLTNRQVEELIEAFLMFAVEPPADKASAKTRRINGQQSWQAMLSTIRHRLHPDHVGRCLRVIGQNPTNAEVARVVSRCAALATLLPTHTAPEGGELRQTVSSVEVRDKHAAEGAKKIKPDKKGATSTLTPDAPPVVQAEASTPWQLATIEITHFLCAVNAVLGRFRSEESQANDLRLALTVFRKESGSGRVDSTRLLAALTTLGEPISTADVGALFGLFEAGVVDDEGMFDGRHLMSKLSDV